MMLQIDPCDLIPEFQEEIPFPVKFEHLSEEAKKALICAGKGFYWHYDRRMMRQPIEIEK